MPAARVCPVPGCPQFTTSGRCDQHRREADKARGTASQRGYTSKGHATFRAAVLAKNPTCVLCHQAPSTVADHYPWSRKRLIEVNLDPNDPQRGRGLCKQCHDTQTAKHQPGGWNA